MKGYPGDGLDGHAAVQVQDGNGDTTHNGDDGHVNEEHRNRTRVEAHPNATAATTAAEVANELITKLRSKLPAHVRIAGVGVAIPGQVRHTDGVVRLAPHLNWVEVPFARMLNQLGASRLYRQRRQSGVDCRT